MKYGSKKVSTSFSIILIFLALIAAAFLYKFFTRQNRKTFVTYSAVAPHPHKKHKRKHKSSIAVNRNIDTVTKPHIIAASNKPAITQPVVTKPLAIKPDSNRTIKPNNTFLYTTYVQPNITGVVKMRAQDKFYSNTIATIPANSKVQVLARGDSYYRVLYNNNIGFVPRWALQVK